MPHVATSKTKIIPRRLKALSVLLHGGLDPLYRRLPAAHRTVALQVQRGEVGPDLAEALQQELGADAWRFITGNSDSFIDQHRAAA